MIKNVKKSETIYLNECTKKTSSYKQKDDAYMNEYMKTKQLTQDVQCKQRENKSVKECIKIKQSTEDLQLSKQKRNKYMKEYMKRKQSTKDPQCKQKRNERNKEYMKRKRSEPPKQCLQSLILKFHNIVSQGPLYICSCCDQLYHLVLP